MRKQYYFKALKAVCIALLWLWQLPQNLAGLVCLALFKAIRMAGIKPTGRVFWFYSVTLPHSGAVCLGEFILIDHRMPQTYNTFLHESGHRIQSRILGPLYLLIIGLPSLCWAVYYTKSLYKHPEISYYNFPTEKWADRLAGSAK